MGDSHMRVGAANLSASLDARFDVYVLSNQDRTSDH